MADDNGVEPDAQQIPVTEIFFAGGLQVRAKGHVAAQVKRAANAGHWSTVKDLNDNETHLRAADALAVVEAVLIPKAAAAPAGTPEGQPFKPKIAK